MGISGRSGVGIANLEEGWELHREANESTVSQIAVESLSRVIASNDSPHFVTRSLRRDGPVLADWCGLERYLVASKVVGDVETLSHDTGRPDSAVWAWAADDAYDALVTETHWRKEASSLYHQIGLPRARITALGPEDRLEEGQQWRIVYSDLFLRVVAHYTREPVLVRAFMDQLDPVAEVKSRLELPEEQDAYAVLLWACFGMDTVYLERTVPTAFKALPDNLLELKSKLNRTLPVLSLGVANAMEDYTRTKQMTSLYGRRVRWGVEMGEVYRQRFCGSVEDLLDICLVVLWNSPEDGFVPDQYANPCSRSINVRGRSNNRSEWDTVLRGVAELRRPLSVPLASTILWED